MDKYRRLLKYAKPRNISRLFALILVLLIVSSCFVAIQPWPMKMVVDYVIGGKPVPESINKVFAVFDANPTRVELLSLAVLSGAAIYLLSVVCEGLVAWCWTLAGRRMVYDLSADLFARLERRPLAFHKRTSVGDTLGRITVDCWSVHNLLNVLLFQPGRAVLTIVAMLFLMAGLDPVLTLVAVMTAPFMIGASFLVGKPLRLAARVKRQMEIRIQSHI